MAFKTRQHRPRKSGTDAKVKLSTFSCNQGRTEQGRHKSHSEKLTSSCSSFSTGIRLCVDRVIRQRLRGSLIGESLSLFFSKRENLKDTSLNSRILVRSSRCINEANGDQKMIITTAHRFSRLNESLGNKQKYDVNGMEVIDRYELVCVVLANI